MPQTFPGGTNTVSGPLPGANSCTGLLLSLPAVDASGNAPVIKVLEQTGAGGFQVTNATVDNYSGGSYTLLPPGTGGSAGGIQFTGSVGIDVVTTTNGWATR